MSLVDELQRLQALHQAGAIDDQEYARAKARLLRPAGSPAAAAVVFDDDDEDDAAHDDQVRQWALVLHLSQFANYLIPLGGFVFPIVIWQLKKTELPEIDAHGRAVANWIVSELIYGVVCLFLVFFVIGIPLLLGLLLVSVVFPVVGAIKANQGTVWEYPLSLPIFG